MTNETVQPALAGQVERGVRPLAMRLAQQLQAAAYSHGYEDARCAFFFAGVLLTYMNHRFFLVPSFTRRLTQFSTGRPPASTRFATVPMGASQNNVRPHLALRTCPAGNAPCLPRRGLLRTGIAHHGGMGSPCSGSAVERQ